MSVLFSFNPCRAFNFSQNWQFRVFSIFAFVSFCLFSVLVLCKQSVLRLRNCLRNCLRMFSSVFYFSISEFTVVVVQFNFKSNTNCNFRGSLMNLSRAFVSFIVAENSLVIKSSGVILINLHYLSLSTIFFNLNQVSHYLFV